MATTANGFPYPINSDPVNVPGDIQALAQATDTATVEIEILMLMGAM